MKTNWIQRLLARIGAPVGASVAADVAAVKAETALIVEDTGTTIPGTITTMQGNVTDILADTDEIQAELADGGRLDLLIDDILLDTGTTIPGTITTMQGNVTDILADTDELQGDWADGGRLDLLIDAIKAVTDALPDAGALSDLADILADTAALELASARQLFTMDFWSDPQEEVQVPAAAATLVLTPTVQVAERPVGATIVRVTAMFKFRMVENTYDGANALDGATDPDTSQVIQVKETTAGAYVDAINFADNQFTLDNLTREGGDVLIGSIDIAGEVDDNGNYTFQWKMRKCDSDFINFNDVQCGLRIWYSI